jgi:hypothetical protein
MSQRLIVRLIPLEAFILAVLLGYLLVTWQVVGPLPAGGPVVQVAGPAQPAAPAGQLSPVFTPEVQRWGSQILAWSQAFALDPNLVATVMQIESCGHPTISSSAGAQGLFQVMPFHFAPGEAMTDPQTNATRGLDYLARGLQAAGGQVGLALAGYNGGHSQIGRDSSLWPRETQRYHYWGTGIYEDAASGASQSPRLAEWLAAGGASLCARAAQAPMPQ